MQLARSVGVVLLAVFAGGAVIGLVEMAGHALVGGDREAAQAGYSAAMYGVVLLAWALGTAVGVYIVTRFRRAHGALALVVVAIFAALALVNLLTIPHPAWVFAAAVVAFGVGGFVGRASAVRQLEEVREG